METVPFGPGGRGGLWCSHNPPFRGLGGGAVLVVRGGGASPSGSWDTLPAQVEAVGVSRGGVGDVRVRGGARSL
ncbi:hypothetical protein B005_4466 [Nocardiopsis alba ATCC BAA-2165]|uniref:Uncharacterized protein n=1 Tax=Nocardiopsis alba (strain ATCC BAA-2165 / BE74) TaxID=1205910 RepID=J7L423_NOCAA|nr:hypothetical protein B005_4466 [Nocardiopsis alba ATCC BAA-2165]